MSSRTGPLAAARTPVDVLAPAPARTGPLGRALAVAFLVAAGVALFVALRGHAGQIVDLLSRPGARWWLVASVLVNVVGLVLVMESWRLVLAGLGSTVAPRPGARIYFVALLGTYLPGPFLSAVAGVQMGRREGVPPRRMVTAYLVSTLLTVLTAAPVAALVGPAVLGAQALWLAPLALLAAVIWWRPALLFTVADRAARLLRRPPVVATPRPGPVRHAVVCAVMSWLVGGLHLWFVAVALGAPAGPSLPLCVGAFALATAAGVVVLVLPDGAGVRELVLLGTLSLVLPVSQAGAAALGSRVSCVVAQLLAAGGAALLHRTPRPAAETDRLAGTDRAVEIEGAARTDRAVELTEQQN